MLVRSAIALEKDNIRRVSIVMEPDYHSLLDFYTVNILCEKITK